MRTNLIGISALLIFAGANMAQASGITATVNNYNNGTGCVTAVNQGCVGSSTYVTGDGAGGTLYSVDFNNNTMVDPNGIATYSGGALNTTNGGSQLAGNNTDFLSENGTTTTITFNTPIDYFGLYWGSIDGSNTVTLYSGGNSLFTFTGSQISGGDSYVSFNMSGVTVDQITIGYAGCCFETDNHSFVTAASVATPEPSTMTTAGTMTIAVPVYFAWRRRRVRAAIK